jgi:hypothetical protein
VGQNLGIIPPALFIQHRKMPPKKSNTAGSAGVKGQVIDRELAANPTKAPMAAPISRTLIVPTAARR